MSMNAQTFFAKILELLPNTQKGYNESIQEYGQLLETVVIEDVFMPEVIALLSSNENTKLLEEIFEFFEEVSVNADEDLRSTFLVTVMEVLGNEKSILEISRCYMGQKTYNLQIEADKGLGRI